MLLKPHSWFGEFFYPDDYENRFSGKVDYTPQGGVVLSYFTGNRLIEEAPGVVHAVVDSRQPLTLLGSFSMQGRLPSTMGGIITYADKVAFPLCILGAWVDREEIFDDVEFVLTNMQEFFFPEGSEHLQKYQNDPIYVCEDADQKIEVSNKASFVSPSQDINAQFYCKNADVLDHLQQCFGSVRMKFPKEMLLVRKDFGYFIRIHLKKGKNLLNLWEHVQSTEVSGFWRAQASVVVGEVGISAGFARIYANPLEIPPTPAAKPLRKPETSAEHSRSFFTVIVPPSLSRKGSGESNRERHTSRNRFVSIDAYRCAYCRDMRAILQLLSNASQSKKLRSSRRANKVAITTTDV